VVTTLAPSPGARRGGATVEIDGVAAVDIGAVITETEGIGEDEPCDALGIRIVVAKTPATAKTAPTASQGARHLNQRRDPDSTGTTPLCLTVAGRAVPSSSKNDFVQVLTVAGEVATQRSCLSARESLRVSGKVSPSSR
jgi:hypothetical protein